jgi:hypothetical protein
MAKLLSESGSAPVKSGNRWRAVLITPGKGASGIYTEQMLKESGPKAFVKGTHSYVDHPRDEEEVRSPKNLIGVLAEDAHYEDGVGLVAELSIMPHWREFVEAVAPHTGLSIYAMGEGNHNEDGEVVVETLVPHVQNSVDLVSYPGRSGSKLAQKLYEAAMSVTNSESYHTDDEKKKKRKKEAEPGELAEEDLVRMDHGGEMAYGQVAYIMTQGVFPFEGDPLAIAATPEAPVALVRVWMQKDGEWEPTQMLMGHAISELTKVSELGEMPEDGEEGTAAPTAAETVINTKEGYSLMELKELSDQIAELPNLVAAAVAEALAPDEEPEEKEESDVAAVAEAMVAADLPEVSRKAVYESLRAGVSLNEAIESQKAFVESVKLHFKEEANASAKASEETVIVNTAEKAPRLSDILNVKVGA